MSKESQARPPSPGARWVSVEVLHRVATDAAYASRALDAEIARAGLDERDARLATDIVYGTLRRQVELDNELGPLLARGLPEPFTLCALRAALYQLREHVKSPAFAVVSETVSIVRGKRGESLAKLTNAVLRKLATATHDAPRSSTVPAWLRAELERGLGEARARVFLEAPPAAPALALRVSPGVDMTELIAELQRERPRAVVQASPLLPGVLRVRGAGDLRTLSSFQSGAFAVQDEGAQLVGALLGAGAGERVLDACAGRGGKTVQLSCAVGPAGEVVALDLHANKLSQLEGEFARLTAPSRLRTLAVDLSIGSAGLSAEFDRVLVDAPCSGSGTILRRPEILDRIEPQSVERLAALQLAILARAAGLVRPGGMLVYAVCSGTAAEGAAVAEALEQRHPELTRDRTAVSGVPLEADPDAAFRIGPWLEQGAFPDVYQVVRWSVAP